MYMKSHDMKKKKEKKKVKKRGMYTKSNKINADNLSFLLKRLTR